MMYFPRPPKIQERAPMVISVGHFIVNEGVKLPKIKKTVCNITKKNQFVKKY